MQHPTHATSLRSKLCACLLLIMALFTLTGCEVIGIAVNAIVPPTKAAVYEIQNRPTVVIVDDPNGLLRDPQYALLAAANCTETLKSNGVVEAMISTQAMTDLAIELGDRWSKTSPHDIGKRLGAKQVILVNVFTASISPAPGLIRPEAHVGVKLFDIDSNQRLFPIAAGTLGTPDDKDNAGYYRFKVEMRHRVTDSDPSRVMAIAQQKLAEEIGLRTALLLFEHDPTKYDDIRTGP